jgi:hypothetical protein
MTPKRKCEEASPSGEAREWSGQNAVRKSWGFLHFY